MNRLTRRGLEAAVLASALALVQGCVVVEEPDASLTFFWNYEGYDCVAAGVSFTVVEVWEERVLHDRLTVLCRTWGLTLQGFSPGWYTYHLDGYSGGGRLLYGAAGTIRAGPGDNVYDVTLFFGDAH